MSSEIYTPEIQNGTLIYRPLFNGSGSVVYGDINNPVDQGLIFSMDLTNGFWDIVSGVNGSFSRASNATYTDKDGQLRIAEIDRARFEVDGLLLEGAGTNKCTCYKYNPVDLTNVTAIGGATLEIVDLNIEPAILTLFQQSGLSEFGDRVFKVTGVSDGGARIEGFADALVEHVGSAYIYSTAKLQLSLTDGTGSVVTTPDSGFVRVEGPSGTPTTTSQRLRIRFSGDSGVFYFTLPQLKEGKYAGSTIVGANTPATASRSTEAADATDNGFSIALDDIPLVKAALQSEGTMVLDWVPGFDSGDPGVSEGLVTVFNGTNSLLKYAAGGALQSYDQTAFLTSTYGYSKSEHIKAALTWSESGRRLWVNGDTATASFDGDWLLASMLRLHYANESSSKYKRLRFYDRALTDEEIANV